MILKVNGLSYWQALDYLIGSGLPSKQIVPILAPALKLFCLRGSQRAIYNVEKHGPPSWRTLVKAVADRIGGADVALALKIAKKYPGKIYTFHVLYKV